MGFFIAGREVVPYRRQPSLGRWCPLLMAYHRAEREVEPVLVLDYGLLPSPSLHAVRLRSDALQRSDHAG